MNINNIEHLKGKRVLVVLRCGFRYEGQFLDCAYDERAEQKYVGGICIVNDRKVGPTTIEVNDISAISEL